MRSDRWEKSHKKILGETYGCGERCEVGCREGRWRKWGGRQGREGLWGKGGTVRCFPNSSLEFIVWKTYGLNLFWGERRTRSHSSASHTHSTYSSLCSHVPLLVGTDKKQHKIQTSDVNEKGQFFYWHCMYVCVISIFASNVASKHTQDTFQHSNSKV